MNPIQFLRIYRKAMKLTGLLQEASVSKSLFTSKIFWFNILTATAGLLQVIPLPPEYTTVGVGVVNVILRLVTDKPVHVVSPT